MSVNGSPLESLSCRIRTRTSRTDDQSIVLVIDNGVLVPNQRRDLLRIQSAGGVDDLVRARRAREVALREGPVEAATLPQAS